MTENAKPPFSKLANVSRLNSDLFHCFSFVLQDHVMKEEARRRHKFAVFSLSVSIYRRHGTEQRSIWCVFIVCLSLEMQQTECAQTHDANSLYVTADHGHILIIRGLIS